MCNYRGCCNRTYENVWENCFPPIYGSFAHCPSTKSRHARKSKTASRIRDPFSFFKSTTYKRGLVAEDRDWILDLLMGERCSTIHHPMAIKFVYQFLAFRSILMWELGNRNPRREKTKNMLRKLKCRWTIWHLTKAFMQNVISSLCMSLVFGTNCIAILHINLHGYI